MARTVTRWSSARGTGGGAGAGGDDVRRRPRDRGRREVVLRDRRKLAGDGIVVVVVTVDAALGRAAGGTGRDQPRVRRGRDGGRHPRGGADANRDGAEGSAADQVTDQACSRRASAARSAKYFFELRSESR